MDDDTKTNLQVQDPLAEGGLQALDLDAVGPMKVIHVDDQPWISGADPTGWIPDGSEAKILSNPLEGISMLLGRFPAGYVMPLHYHPHDIAYVITAGELIIDGEGTYRPGDVRWTKGGTIYGPERAGPEGCEFYLISAGPFAVHDPDAPQG